MLYSISVRMACLSGPVISVACLMRGRGTRCARYSLHSRSALYMVVVLGDHVVDFGHTSTK